MAGPTAGSDRPERIFDAVRAVIAETGVLKGKRRRALDSTLLDDAVATQDTVTQLISAIRRARRADPGRGGSRSWRMTTTMRANRDRVGRPDRQRRAGQRAGERRVAILAAIEDVALAGEEADAVGLLALVAGQDVEPGEADGTWRIAERVAPDRVISTVDPDARHMHKSVSEYRDGYKAHVAVEPETGLVTAAAITPANAGDGPTGVALLEPRGTRPAGARRFRLWLRRGPRRVPRRAASPGDQTDPAPARVPGGFDRDDFIIDHAPHRTCPADTPSRSPPKGTPTFGVRCRGCPLRDRCTDRQRRPHASHQRTRHRTRRSPPCWRDGDFTADYRQWRPMVERSIAWLVARGHRRVRYRGVERNQLGLTIRVAAINLRRLVNLGLTRGPTGWALA